MKTPFLFNFAVSRKNEDEKPFFYDDNLNLNVLTKNNKKFPFVECDMNALEFRTKTEIEREEDEASISIRDIETSTRNNENQNKIPENLLELFTKTKVEREGDDE